MENKICAGIVLYNPTLEILKKNVQSVIEQVDFVFIVDNASSNIIDIENELLGEKQVKLIKYERNRGIACALNELCKQARLEGYNWILTLDQDSICPQNMITEYQKQLSSAEILCPQICDRNWEKNRTSRYDVEYVRECITSGNLVKISAWEKVNGFDEKMFIDGVDFDFCYRIVQEGFSILRVNNVLLSHEIGKITVRYFFGFRVIVKNHSAFRKYYIAKNIIYIARKRKSVMLLIKGMLQELKLLGIVFFYEEEKSLKMKKILRGIIDGFGERI